jgi:predicted Zn-dependent protease
MFSQTAFRSAGLATALLLALALSCARNPVTGRKQLSLMSTKQEIALGLEANPQVLSEFGVYQDSALQQFITEKGKAMAGLSHRPKLPWAFKLVDSPVVNAFALPGGYVYFTRGIMAHFNDEAQFMGVLGHEIGHVTARHGAEQYTKTTLAQLGLVVGMIASPKFAQFGDIAGQGVQLLLLKNSRDNESQSDELGVLYASKVGYDAVHMAGFFQTLQRLSDKASGGHQIPTFLSTHPDPGDRYNKVRSMAQEWQRKHPGRTLVVNREAYLRRIDGLVYGEDPRQGYVEAGRFYHPELKFQFPIPQGWQSQNMPTQFQMAPPTQDALLLLTLSGQKNLQAAANESLQRYSLRLLDSKETSINGLPGLVTLAEQVQQAQQQQQGGGGQQPQPTGIVILSTYLQYNGLTYVLHGVTEKKDYQRYENIFLGTMRGFDKLSDPAKLNVKPERVRIKTVAKEQTLAEALSAFGMPQGRQEELSVLNGMKASERVKAGTLIKVVER